MSVQQCYLIDLPKISDRRGHLSFVEGGRHIPFDIRRVYYLYGVPPDAGRGAHGHRALQQLIISLAGSVEIEVDDGTSRRSFLLDEPSRALYVSPMIWRDLRHFSKHAVVLVLASLAYNEGDYFRHYEDFRKAALTQ